MVDSKSALHRAHLEGPSIPLLVRLYVVRNLLCISSHVKQLTFGIQFGFQTFFDRFAKAVTKLVWSSLYPSLIVSTIASPPNGVFRAFADRSNTTEEGKQEISSLFQMIRRLQQLPANPFSFPIPAR